MSTPQQIEILDANWMDLWPHAQRGALVLVKPGVGLSLAEVARAMAEDSKQLVENWVNSGLIYRPSDGELDRWKTQLHKPFRFTIVQPFVVATEIMEN